MPKGKPVTLTNGKTWSKKGDANKHFSNMLNHEQYDVGSTISDSDHHSDLLALVTAYDAVDPQWAGAKTGSGVAHFVKGLDDEPSRVQYGSKCFFVVRTDGTKAHFSTNRAIDAIS